MENPVRTSTLSIVDLHAKKVSVRKDAIKEIARKWASEKPRTPEWPKAMHLETENESTLLTYFFILDGLNFCFWSKGKRWGNYFTLSLALKKFFEENPGKANFPYLANIPYQEYLNMLQGGRGLLFLEKRWEHIRNISRVMVREYRGDARRLLEKAKKDCELLVPKIAALPSFDDEAMYKGRKVYFWKRAQILAGDIWGACGGKGIGKLKNLGYLTAFADYKLPLILRHWNILEYAPKLEEKIQKRKLIPQGSEEEIEIRAATIWAVEWLKEELKKLGVRKNAFEIDWFLWNKSKELNRAEPHHLTRTIYY